MMDAGRYDFRIELPIRNEWENIERVRVSVLEFFVAVFHDVHGCRSLANVAGELMENAMKYGDWSASETHLYLRICGDDARARVEVQSPIDPAAPELGELLDTLAWLRATPDARAAFESRILAAAARPPGQAKLGLTRVAYEGGCTIEASVDGRTLTVLASRTFP
ncbi:MAG TPA: hypothetical protein VKE22_14615 [Haliangiales bacterium]|nr:hypothetical protein [Haliangiales bacterium]